MSSSNNRFGRRTARQNDDLRAEPVLSFNPKRPAARDGQSDPAPSGARRPQNAPRIEREDAEEFGVSARRDASVGRDRGPRIERDDDFDPRVRREKAMEDRVPDAERPLYHHLFDEQENRRRSLGWLAALGSVAVVAIGAGFAWHNFMDRPAPAGLFEPPGVASRGNSGYMTPTQPATNADTGLDTGSTPSPLAATPPTSTAPSDQPATKDIAATPAPKSVPYEPPPPPKKTISEAAANPGSLGPPSANGAANPPPAAKKEPAAAPAPIMTPPKREAAKPEAKHEAPRKEASITPPKPVPAPPQDAAPPPVMAEPAAAPAESAPPPRPRSRAPQASPPQADGQPQPLNNRNAPANYAPPPQQTPQQQPNFATRSPPPGAYAPQQQQSPYGNAGAAPGSPDTVTVDGMTYVSGQEPHALGTLGAPPDASSYPAMSPAPPAQSAPPAYSTRPYTPTDHDGGAPLPNDVVILPNGQMAVPNGPYGR